MTSKLLLSAASAVLAAAGFALLFAAEELVLGLASSGSGYIGQLLGGAWLAVAATDWLARTGPAGGIYGRPVVSLNTTLFFVSALVLMDAAGSQDSIVAVAAAIMGLFAAAFLWLMLRGPFGADRPSAA